MSDLRSRQPNDSSHTTSSRSKAVPATSSSSQSSGGAASGSGGRNVSVGRRTPAELAAKRMAPAPLSRRRDQIDEENDDEEPGRRKLSSRGGEKERAREKPDLAKKVAARELLNGRRRATSDRPQANNIKPGTAIDRSRSDKSDRRTGGELPRRDRSEKDREKDRGGSRDDSGRKEGAREEDVRKLRDMFKESGKAKSERLIRYRPLKDTREGTGSGPSLAVRESGGGSVASSSGAPSQASKSNVMTNRVRTRSDSVRGLVDKERMREYREREREKEREREREKEKKDREVKEKERERDRHREKDKERREREKRLAEEEEERKRRSKKEGGREDAPEEDENEEEEGDDSEEEEDEEEDESEYDDEEDEEEDDDDEEADAEFDENGNLVLLERKPKKIVEEDSEEGEEEGDDEEGEEVDSEESQEDDDTSQEEDDSSEDDEDDSEVTDNGEDSDEDDRTKVRQEEDSNSSDGTDSEETDDSSEDEKEPRTKDVGQQRIAIETVFAARRVYTFGRNRLKERLAVKVQAILYSEINVTTEAPLSAINEPTPYTSPAPVAVVGHAAATPEEVPPTAATPAAEGPDQAAEAAGVEAVGSEPTAALGDEAGESGSSGEDPAGAPPQADGTAVAKEGITEGPDGENYGRAYLPEGATATRCRQCCMWKMELLNGNPHTCRTDLVGHLWAQCPSRNMRAHIREHSIVIRTTGDKQPLPLRTAGDDSAIGRPVRGENIVLRRRPLSARKESEKDGLLDPSPHTKSPTTTSSTFNTSSVTSHLSLGGRPSWYTLQKQRRALNTTGSPGASTSPRVNRSMVISIPPRRPRPPSDGGDGQPPMLAELSA